MAYSQENYLVAGMLQETMRHVPESVLDIPTEGMSQVNTGSVAGAMVNSNLITREHSSIGKGPKKENIFKKRDFPNHHDIIKKHCKNFKLAGKTYLQLHIMDGRKDEIVNSLERVVEEHNLSGHTKIKAFLVIDSSYTDSKYDVEKKHNKSLRKRGIKYHIEFYKGGKIRERDNSSGLSVYELKEWYKEIITKGVLCD